VLWSGRHGLVLSKPIVYVERLIGSIRLECLDHVIILNETGLLGILKSYFD
jgi:hypothetical protein